jgi:hypothetical protein
VSQWLLGLLLVGVLLVLLNLVLAVSGLGNIKRIAFISELKKLLRRMPSDQLLACHNGKVEATAYDAQRHTQTSVPLWSGSLLTWSGEPRSAGAVLRRAEVQYRWRLAVLLVILVPLFIISVWYAFVVSWIGLIAAALLVVHQIFPFNVGPSLDGFLG